MCSIFHTHPTFAPGAYVGFATVGAFVAWFLFDSFFGLNLGEVSCEIWLRSGDNLAAISRRCAWSVMTWYSDL